VKLFLGNRALLTQAPVEKQNRGFSHRPAAIPRLLLKHRVRSRRARSCSTRSRARGQEAEQAAGWQPPSPSAVGEQTAGLQHSPAASPVRRPATVRAAAVTALGWLAHTEQTSEGLHILVPLEMFISDVQIYSDFRQLLPL